MRSNLNGEDFGKNIDHQSSKLAKVESVKGDTARFFLMKFAI